MYDISAKVKVSFISDIICIHKRIQFSITEINVEIKATATAVKHFLISEGNTCVAEPNLDVLPLI